jgi:hypothetical protein
MATTTQTQTDNAPAVLPFKLKADAKEYASRFGGNVLNVPNIRTMDELRQYVDPTATFDDVLLGLVRGQGTTLSFQKVAKEYLHDVGKDVNVEEALKGAQAAIDNHRFGAPRQRGSGRTGKTAAAEARANAAEERAQGLQQQLLAAYNLMPKASRKAFRTDLLAGGQVTEEQLDAIDNA